jgi:hypothetical protein
MIIQIVGLPGTGKSFLIKKFLQKNKYKNIFYLDIINFKHIKSLIFKAKSLSQKNNIVILESACGISNLSSIVLLHRTSKRNYVNNCLKRGIDINSSELLLIKENIIPAHYTTYTPKSFEVLLNSLIRKEKNERTLLNKRSTRQIF